MIKRHFVDILESRLKKELNFIQVLLGPRQVGKTTGVRQILENWQGPKQYLTADKLPPPDYLWLEAGWQTARKQGDGTLLVIDEIQKVPKWSEQVKILFDEDRPNKKLKVVLLGSASLSLQKGLSESLTGRFELIRATHWTYSESKKYLNWDLNTYLKFGGYPSAAEFIGEQDRWQELVKNSIIQPVLSQDIMGQVSISKPALFKQTFELAMCYPAQVISLQKLLGQLQDSGNVTTIKHYLELFEGAFLLKALQKYSGRALQVRGSSPKILPLAPALIHAFSPASKIEDREWRGRVFEAAIGAHLARSRGELYYWRQGKYEVDYVLELNDKIYAIEVKSGRKRFSRGLDLFYQHFPESILCLIDEELGLDFLQTEDVEEWLSKRFG